MKKIFKRLAAIVIICALVLPMAPSAGADYIPPTDVIRVGLYNDSQKSYVSANLQNAAGLGYGYRFGYYNGDRQFVDLGVSVTDTNKISISVDKNLVWDASTRSYKEGSSGSVVVGCFHVQLDPAYPDAGAALEAASAISGQNVFLKYSGGSFFVCIGNYISASAASTAGSAMKLPTSWNVTSGTSCTVTVTETGTSRILFEFEYDNTYSLAVRSIGNGFDKAQTYFKGIKYYGDFSYVRPSRGNITVVNYVNIDDYIKGILPTEMSASWPIEALKAQAVCARTYSMRFLNKHSSEGFDICNTTDCQAYKGTTNANANTDKAVDETAGMYLTYNGELCETYYYSHNGGASESSENVWTYPRPYLVGKTDPYEAAVVSQIYNYNWVATFTGAQIAAKLKARGYNSSNIVKFEILDYTENGNVLRIRFTDTVGRTFTFSKEMCRLILGLRSQRYTLNGVRSSDSITFINSAASFITGLLSGFYAIGSGGVSQISGTEYYAITGTGEVDRVGDADKTEANGSTFVINGSGWGHNVGMSQWGAYSMAKNYGMKYNEILEFYYTGAEIITAK